MSAFAAAGALVLRCFGVVQALLSRQVSAREVVRLVDDIVADAAVTVALGSVVIGGIVGMQGLGYLERYNASDVFGWAAAMSAFRDVGPLLLAFALAARVGTRNSAQTATLAVRERLDALAALGLDPRAAVAAPRVIAIVVAALVLYPLAAALILGVGFVFARILGGQSLAVSMWSVVEYVDARVIGEGLLRLSCFGLWIGLCTTEAGFSLWASSSTSSTSSTSSSASTSSARAVGDAVFRGSVWSLTGVVLVNLALSLLGGT
jgi:phospholipid/cholesterol/gamma-HCH transport system permease protein